MEFILKGAGHWRIIIGSENSPRRPSPPSDPLLATASSSRNTRSSSSVDNVQVAFGVALEAYETTATQYQNRCDLAASFIYSSLTVEARQYLGGVKEPCEM